MTPFRPFTVTEGSSPRVRGKPNHAASTGVGSRIIPARAGQTSSNRDNGRYPPDHPRACGANAVMSGSTACTIGSSPRVRGKHGQGHVGIRLLRIIPARAGQTISPKSALTCASDHPRACGANQ